MGDDLRGHAIGSIIAVVVVCTGIALTIGVRSDEAVPNRILRSNGSEIHLGASFAPLRERFVRRSTLFQAKDNASLFIGVDNGIVTAIMSTGGSGVSVPGFRFGLPLKVLRGSPFRMTPIELAGRPGMVADRDGFRFFALALPDNITCQFRGTADVVIITSRRGEDLVRVFLVTEQSCIPGDDKSGLV